MALVFLLVFAGLFCEAASCMNTHASPNAQVPLLEKLVQSLVLYLGWLFGFLRSEVPCAKRQAAPYWQAPVSMKEEQSSVLYR
jgi:hypothetical protein